MARRLDFENKSHVINVDIPNKRSKNDEDAPGGSYRREITKKSKKTKTRGDKNYSKRNKRK